LNELLNKIKELLRPGQVVKEIGEINFAALKAKGIKALILDIDDTLLPREVNDISPQLFEWVINLKEQGFRLCLTSNSRHPMRVKYIGDTLGVPAISFVFNPLPFDFIKSLEIIGSRPAETAMVGDQLFMDILGANLQQIYSIFIDHQKAETIWPRIWMRQAEQWVLARLRRAG